MVSKRRCFGRLFSDDLSILLSHPQRAPESITFASPASDSHRISSRTAALVCMWGPKYSISACILTIRGRQCIYYHPLASQRLTEIGRLGAMYFCLSAA